MDMSLCLAVLAAAFLHAGWNSVVKVGLDRFSAVLLLALVQAAIAVPTLAFVPAPAPASWAWIAVSALLHMGYKIFLVNAYDHADLSQAYPIARGSAPLLVFLYSLLCLGVSFTATETTAVLAISGGVLVMAIRSENGRGERRRMRGAALLFSLGTAAFTASYTLVDGTGARVAGGASSFMPWMVIGDAIGMTVYAAWSRGGAWVASVLPAWKVGLCAGAMSLGSYWIAVWAFTAAPIALVAALRETSILFATVIAAIVLREPVTRWRWISAACIAAGVVLIGL